VPFLCIASSAGITRVQSWLARDDARELVAASIAASFVLTLFAFLPVQLRAIRIGAVARDEIFQQLRDDGATRAVVLGNLMVPPDAGLTWAYFPPNPWPDLRDDVVFLRVPDGADGRERAIELARRQFADRPRFEMVVTSAGTSLVRL
jgi:hypothetical protein